MSLIAKDTTKDFVPAPAGLHPARLVELVDMGVQQKERFGKLGMQHRIRFVFQIEELMPQSGLAYCVSTWHNLTLADKGTLRPFLESWLGRRLDDREIGEGIELESFIDRTAYIQLIHTERNGTVYADIVNIMPLPTTIGYSFPEYVRMTGEVVRGELAGHGTTADDVQRSIITTHEKAVIPSKSSSRGALLQQVQQLGVSLHGRQWPAARARIVGELGLQDRMESFDEEKLATVLMHLQVEAEEMAERAAA